MAYRSLVIKMFPFTGTLPLSVGVANQRRC